jgi:putative endonuclease
MRKVNDGFPAEEAASNYLQRKGYLIISRNYHCRYGEIDIIALKAELIVFIEVKSRRGDMEAAFSSVSIRKRLKLIRSALHFIQNNPQYEKQCMRFDVIGAVDEKREGFFRLEHLEDAFRADGLEEYI